MVPGTLNPYILSFYYQSYRKARPRALTSNRYWYQYIGTVVSVTTAPKYCIVLYCSSNSSVGVLVDTIRDTHSRSIAVCRVHYDTRYSTSTGVKKHRIIVHWLMFPPEIQYFLWRSCRRRQSAEQTPGSQLAPHNQSGDSAERDLLWTTTEAASFGTRAERTSEERSVAYGDLGTWN